MGQEQFIDNLIDDVNKLQKENKELKNQLKTTSIRLKNILVTKMIKDQTVWKFLNETLIEIILLLQKIFKKSWEEIIEEDQIKNIKENKLKKIEIKGEIKC